MVYDQSWNVTLENDDQIITVINPTVNTTFGSNSYLFEIEAWNGVEIKSKEKMEADEKVSDIELYEGDLCTLQEVLQYLDSFMDIGGIVDVEIRIKPVNSNIWAVVGYGESGDPAVIRFEEDV